MKGSEKLRYFLAGAAAGAVNGFFGGGGGTLLVPLLHRWCRLPEQKSFATSVAVILPLCALSACIYLACGELDALEALPYLLGGAAGGALGGKLFRNTRPRLLRRVFSLLLLCGGIRALL